MTATITVDETGQINLPDALKRVFGAEPGDRLRTDVTPDRIEIVRDAPVVTEGVVENGLLLLPRLGIKMDAAAAIRADRDEHRNGRGGDKRASRQFSLDRSARARRRLPR
ncbi:MAG TPA: hypothetical protein VG796_03270 [Verrucomicrobiales bacterium]|nr:hypothetical protein [Verrucomicrobiales bacterium]